MAYKILVREAFTLRSVGDGIIEQIDGCIEWGGHLYLVEVKWYKERIGPEHVAQHINRVIFRADARGLIISASGFTAAAIKSVGEALHYRMMVLGTLEELVRIAETCGDMQKWLRRKVEAATCDKTPFVEIKDA